MTARKTPEQRAREAEIDERLTELETREELAETMAPDLTLGQVLEAMGKTVVTGEVPTGLGLTPEEQAEKDRLFAEEARLLAADQEAIAAGKPLPDIEAKPDVASAFDRGARLVLPPPPVEATTSSRPTGKEKTDKTSAPRARAPRSVRSSAARPSGSDELTSLFAAGFIALISFSLGDWALPTEDEALMISRPVGNILARRIDLAAKLGQDANDTVALAVALIAYGTRVGPIAAGKAREAYSDRARRLAARRVSRAGTTPDDNGQDGMASGTNGTEHAAHVAAFDPFHALTQARDIGLGKAGGNPHDA